MVVEVFSILATAIFIAWICVILIYAPIILVSFISGYLWPLIYDYLYPYNINTSLTYRLARLSDSGKTEIRLHNSSLRKLTELGIIHKNTVAGMRIIHVD